MGRLLTGIAGALGLAWLWRFLRKEQAQQQPRPDAGPDPAEELRAKLAQARETADDRDEFDAAEGQPVDEVERPPHVAAEPARGGRGRGGAVALARRAPPRDPREGPAGARGDEPPRSRRVAAARSGHTARMRIVVVGATGNVGTSVLEALGRDDAVDSVLGLARRLATATYAKTEFAAADVTRDDLVRALPRRRLRHPSRLADPALARPAHALADQRRRLLTRARRGGGGRRSRPRRRLLDRRLLAGPEGARRRELAARGDPGQLVLAPQGGARAASRSLRVRARDAGRPPAPGADHEAGERRERASPLHRPVPAEPARQAGPAAGLPARPRSRRPARPLARRRRGLPARGDARRSRRLQHRRRARGRRPDDRRRRSAPAR